VIIGLNGVSEVGKDEVGRILRMKYNAVTFALADKVREFALAVDPWVPIDPYVDVDAKHARGQFVRLSKLVQEVGWDAAKKNKEVRRLLQRIGTEGGRNVVGEKVWIKLIEEEIRTAKTYKKNMNVPIVITDVRFLNEADWIRSRDGIVIRVTRPGYGPVNDHVSDNVTDTSLWDYVLPNDGTLEQLELRVVREIGPLMAEKTHAPQA